MMVWENETIIEKKSKTTDDIIEYIPDINKRVEAIENALLTMIMGEITNG